MTFPTGGPGGYPAQPQQGGYGQPQQGPGYGPPPAGGGGVKLTPTQLIAAGVAFFGLVSLLLGFAPVIDTGSSSESVNFFEYGGGWINAVIGTAGLFAALVVLPGKKDVKWGGLVLVANVGGVLPALFTLWSLNDTLGIGAVILMIVAIVQFLGAVALYLFESGIVAFSPKQPAYPSYGYGQPGGYGPPPQQGPSGYGPPAGSAPQSTQVFGSAQGPYGQPQSGQPQPGQQGPGTPPGGTPGPSGQQGPSTPPGGFGGPSPQG